MSDLDELRRRWPEPDVAADFEHSGYYAVTVTIPVDITGAVDNTPLGAACRMLDWLREAGLTGVTARHIADIAELTPAAHSALEARLGP